MNAKRSRLLRPTLTVFLTVAFLATYVAPTFALSYTEHASVVGKTGIFNLPGGYYDEPTLGMIPIPVEITVAHYDGGDHGVRDNLMIFFIRPSGYRVHVAWYSDTEAGSELNAAIMYNYVAKKPMPTLIETLEPHQLQICKIGKTVIAWWTAPLEVPSQSWSASPVPTPPITIPPGCLILRGQGTPTSQDTPYPPGPGNYKSTWTESYDAYGFLMCPKWRRNAIVKLGTPGDTQVFIDRTYTATLPDPT